MAGAKNLQERLSERQKEKDEQKMCIRDSIEILQADIILFVEETLFLNAGHVKNVQLGQLVFQTDDFFIRNIFFTQHLCDIIRNPQLGRGNEDEPEVVVAGEPSLIHI